jgi:acetylornithine deacetylase/succinyl-diaminopimelate desuccinylase-like protein
MDEPEVRARLREVLGEDGYRLDFFERTTGNASPVETPLMEALRGWVAATDPQARCLPTISVGYSDSRTFRAHFPDCVAYGFFPHVEQSSYETARLIHSHDERIDVRDLALATACFRDVAVGLLGTSGQSR